MPNKKSNLTITLFLGIMSFFIFQIARAENVEVKPGFYDQYVEYLKSLPSPTPLNGGPSNELMEVVPSYRMPFSVLKISLDPSNTLTYGPGEKVNLKANLSFAYKGDENLSTIRNLCLEKVKDQSQCKMPSAFKIPELNKLGIYVQVWRKDESSKSSDKGDYLVDEFYSLEDQSLFVNQNKDFNINWTVPSEIKGGSYYFLLFLNEDKSFDILGTPLVIYSETKRFDFVVKSKGNSGIELDKNNIKVSSQDYAYRKPAPTIKGDEVTVEIPLSNLNGTDEQSSIKYELYRWGRINPKDLIDSKVENKFLKANSQEPLKYVFTPNAIDSVYDLKIIASTSKSISSSTVRFVIEGKNRGIFRFLSFVTDKGENTPMFCIRNANWSGKFEGKIRLTMGNEKFEQSGSINADDGKCFVLNNKLRIKNDQCGIVKGEIFDKNGNLVDSREATVNCKERKNISSAGVVEPAFAKANFDLIYLFILSMLLLIGGVIIIKTKNKK